MRCLRRFTAVLLCAAILSVWLTGCAERDDLMEVRIAYRAENSADGDVFSYTTRRIAVSEGERLCSIVLQLAMTEPEDETLTSAFPRRTTVRSVELSDRGVITVDFSGEYGSLAGIARTIADYCTVLTLFALGSVNDVPVRGVMITVEGAGDRLVLTPDDIVDHTDYMRLHEYVFRIYFPNRAEGTLTADTFTCTLSDAEQPAETIVSLLTEGRQSDGSINHVVPDDTEFLGLTIRNRVCYLNFNEAFLNLAIRNADGYSLKLYAFVNSLCELSYIDRVQFLIDGEAVTSTVYDNFDTPYSPNQSLVA